MNKKILVTKPSLPPIEEFIPHLKNIWDSNILTNSGPYHELLEIELAKYLGVRNLVLVSNGTTALMLTISALDLSGEIITTPYTFAATATSIIWSRCKPVFVDVDIETCNIDPKKIEAAITPHTSAILAVHCYGIPCDIHALRDISIKNGIKCIYDAAHCFDVKDSSGSILNYGDASTLSFHATKVFNTIEGGAIVCEDPRLAKKLKSMRNFGLQEGRGLNGVGFNAKLNEINSSIGLLQLKYIKENIQMRKEVSMCYDSELSELKNVQVIKCKDDVNQNYSYYPIRILKSSKTSRDEIYNKLIEHNIYARKYFYPAISELMDPSYFFQNEKPVNSFQLADEVLCLPIYPDLQHSECKRISDILSTCR